MKPAYSRHALILTGLLVLFYSLSSNAQCSYDITSLGGNDLVDWNGHHISNVTIDGDNSTAEINNTNSNTRYTDYTGIPVDMTAGNTYNFSVNSSIPWSDIALRIWVDYDNDGNYTQVYTDGFSGTNPKTGSFTIDPLASTGTAKLRIQAAYCSGCGGGSDAGVLSTDGCNFANTYRGDVEDYTINISGATILDPIANDDDLTVLVDSVSGALNQIDVSGNDNIGTSDGTDGDDYSINTSPSNGVVTEITDGVFEYIPNSNFIGTDSFIYNLCDSNNDCDTATVNVTVNFGTCTPVSNSSGTHYITNVLSTGEVSSSINNTSGDNLGYADFTSTVSAITYYKGSSYPFSISVNNSDGQSMGWSIYLDINGDGDFDDVDETLYDTGGTESIPFATQNITIPTSAINGNTVLRVGTRRYWSSNNSCGQTGQPEEFEDYLINLEVDPFSPAEIDITGNNNVIIDGSTTTNVNNNTNFGVYDIYSTIPQEKTFTITNNGSLTLNLTGTPIVEITGSADFTISIQPVTTAILSSNTTSFTVAFNPSAPTIGTRTATISIANDDADENPYTFVVEGYGDQTFPDTDNDGIPDNVDIDDDNDGLLDATEQVSCVASPVATTTDVIFLNEDFQSGTTRGTILGASYCYEDGFGSCNGSINLNDGEYVVYYRAANGDTTNDTPNGEVAQWADAYWYPGLDHTPGDTNGRMAMFNASEDPGVFYETTITGVSAGVDITYGFSALNLDRADIDALELASRERPSVLIEILDPTGAVIASSSSGLIEPTADYVTGDWVDVSATFNTTYTQFTVRLSNENLGGLGNDLAIDDIFVLQTLCDLDGDGVEDSVDLDNDDDGIPNVVELQLTDDDKDGTVNNDTGAYTWVDVNNNGLHDLYDPQDAAGRNPGDSGFTVSLGTEIDLTDPIYDTDGDGILDYLDLDSDNDGVFDVVEYDNRGDTDINGDGNGDGSDKQVLDSSNNPIDNDEFDGDGILGAGDANDDDVDGLDHGTGSAYPTPLDDDGDGIPNFRDVDKADNPNDFSNGSDIDDTEIYAHLDANNDGVLDDTVDTDNDGILDIFDTDNTVFGSPRDLNNSHTLFFDGRNDYVAEASVINGWTDVTLMSWVKIESGATGKRVIVGQDEIQLLITNTGNVSAVANGTTLTTGSVIAEDIWIHVAAIYDGTNGAFTLYINGEQDSTTSISGALPSDSSSFTIGRTPDTDSDYFEGQVDEVRVFTKALTALELQRMVYQELTSAERGTIIPIDISAALTGTLSRYYKMDAFTHDITENGSTGAKLYNIKDIYFQTAPLPYETIVAGDWSDSATWLHGDVWDISSEATNKDWSIVNIKHNAITSNSHATYGLIVDSGAKLEVNNDVELQNSWYLSLDGKIDLQGESQLVQTETSILVGTGNLERDQQGTENLYTYNYWSSPVHSFNPDADIDGNETYTVSSVLMDGADPDNPQPITFVGGRNYDGDSTTTPIEIADYWIWKFDNRTSDTYSEWQSVRSSGNLLVGEGYTMKGPGTASVSTNRNYVFNGTPNNGEINLFTSGGNDYFIGNPYPSAIDGAEFINDNPHLNGTLYFWEHYGGGSHILIEYQGGYALYNLSGSVPPIDGTLAVSHPDVDQTGGGTKVPKRYIPVGQGFFVTATSNGNTKFENDQRVFVTEAGGTNSLFIKKSNSKNEQSETLVDNRPKLRIGYKSPKGYIRQLLVTVDTNASLDYDRGYEGALIEDNVEDMYWKINNANYIIQGINEIDPIKTKLPLSIKTGEEGIIEISIDALENIEDDTEVYLRDKINNVYHNLKDSNYVVRVAEGVIDDRFEIVFSPQNQLSNSEFDNDQELVQFYDNSNKLLVVLNPKGLEIETLMLINTLGQVIFEDNIGRSEKRIEVPANIATGVYISKITLSNIEISKKLIINQ